MLYYSKLRLIMPNKLKFQPISEFDGGTLYNLLTRTYKGSPLENYENIKQKWADYDTEAYNNLETVGKCGFITEINNKTIGFASYDPRQKPIGIIGHNCILPEYRGNGYGKQQILEIIRILKKLGFTELIVNTDEHPFFIPAQNMYLSCGFAEVRRMQNKNLPQYNIIDYRKDI